MGLIFNGNDANMQIKVKFNFVSKKLGMAWKMIIGRAIDVNKPKREQLRYAILQINLMFKSFLVNTPYFESKLSENIFVIEEYEYNALVNEHFLKNLTANFCCKQPPFSSETE